MEDQSKSCCSNDDSNSCCQDKECKPCCKVLPFILTFAITALLVGGGVYYWQNSKAPVKPPSPVVVKTDTTKSTDIVKTDKVEDEKDSNKTYKNNYFSFKYPKAWVTEGVANRVSLFSPERKKEYDSLIKSGKPFGGQIANISMNYTINYKSNPKKFTDILKTYDVDVVPKLISNSKINDNNVTKYDFQGYGSEIVYFAEVGNHLAEFYIAKGNDEKVMDDILKSMKAISNAVTSEAQKTFSDYIKNVSENMDTKFDPTGWVNVYTAKGVYNPCGVNPAGVCGNDVAILAKNGWDKLKEKQVFYLKHYHKNPSAITIVYRGPFTDDLSKIVKEAKQAADKVSSTKKASN